MILLFRRKKNLYEDIDEYNIKINNLNGVFYIIAYNLVIPFATIFAKRLEASDVQVAMLQSLPALVSVGAIIPGAIYIQKCINKKKATMRFFIASRAFCLLFAFVPFVSGHFQASLFVLLYGLMNLPGSIALASWQSYIAGLFPPRLRASALASRSRISTLVGVITTLITGYLLQSIPKNNEQRIMLYQLFFIAAFIFASVEIYLFSKHKEPVNSKCTSNVNSLYNPIDMLQSAGSELKSNKRFIDFCLVSVIFHFSWYMAWPLFPLYEIDKLNSNEAWTSIIAAVPAISSAIAYPRWGKLISKIGNALPLAIAATIMSAAPLLYPYSNSLYTLLPINAFNAVGYSGVMLILLNTVFEVSPPESRTMYIAFYNTMANAMLVIAPLTGIILKNLLSIESALLIAGCARFLSGALFFLKYRTEKRTPAK